MDKKKSHIASLTAICLFLAADLALAFTGFPHENPSESPATPVLVTASPDAPLAAETNAAQTPEVAATPKATSIPKVVPKPSPVASPAGTPLALKLGYAKFTISGLDSTGAFLSGDELTFTATTPNITSCEWTLAPGIKREGCAFSYTYPDISSVSRYYVTLKVVTQDGRVGYSFSQRITQIQPLPMQY